MRILLLSLLLLVPAASLAQVFEAPLTVVKGKGLYPTIEFMSAAQNATLVNASNAEDLPPTTPQAQTLRLVVYRSEIYQSLVIETISTGLEGCCAKVVHARSFDLAAFAAHFGFKGEVTGFEFIGWSSPRSFHFMYNGKPFHATVTNGGHIRVGRSLGANNSSKPKIDNSCALVDTLNYHFRSSHHGQAGPSHHL